MTDTTSGRRDRIVVRPNDDGSLDEIVVYDASGECVFHLEQMGDTCYWMRAYQPGGPDLVAHIWSEIGPLLPDEDDEPPERQGTKVESNYEWE